MDMGVARHNQISTLIPRKGSNFEGVIYANRRNCGILSSRNRRCLNLRLVRYAPIAQWIERCPPEAKTRVRVAVGVQVVFRPAGLNAKKGAARLGGSFHIWRHPFNRAT